MSVVLSTVTTLSEYAQDLLTVSETSLATTLGGVPDRSYVTASAPAFDCCPFLSVHVARLAEAPTSPLAPPEASALRGKFGNVILATYVISAVRCAPTVGANGMPRIIDIETSAQEVQEDGWALWNGLRHAVNAGTIFDGCLGVHFDGGVPIPEQGGCVGWLFTIRASIPGIPA